MTIMKKHFNQYTLMAAMGAAFAVTNIYRSMADGHVALCVLFVIMFMGAVGLGIIANDEPEQERETQEEEKSTNNNSFRP